MTEFKLDVSYNSEQGTVRLHVFDLDDDSDGPLETCEVGAELDSRELRRAWGRFGEGYDGLETATADRGDWDDSMPTDAGETLFGDMDEFIDENQDADEL